MPQLNLGHCPYIYLPFSSFLYLYSTNVNFDRHAKLSWEQKNTSKTSRENMISFDSMFMSLGLGFDEEASNKTALWFLASTCKRLHDFANNFIFPKVAKHIKLMGSNTLMYVNSIV